MTFRGTLRRWTLLREVTKLVVFETLEILFVEQYLYALLYVCNLWQEAALDLRNSFADKLVVLHLLTRLHDTDNGRLDLLLVSVLED